MFQMANIALQVCSPAQCHLADLTLFNTTTVSTRNSSQINLCSSSSQSSEPVGDTIILNQVSWSRFALSYSSSMHTCILTRCFLLIRVVIWTEDIRFLWLIPMPNPWATSMARVCQRWERIGDGTNDIIMRHHYIITDGHIFHRDVNGGQMDWDVNTFGPAIPMCDDQARKKEKLTSYWQWSSSRYWNGVLQTLFVNVPAIQLMEPFGSWEGPFISSLMCLVDINNWYE